MKSGWTRKRKTNLLGTRPWSSFLALINFPGSSSGKEPACQRRKHKDAGLIPALERSLGGVHGNTLQYACLENRQRSLVGYSPSHSKESDTTEATQHSTINNVTPAPFLPPTFLCSISTLCFSTAFCSYIDWPSGSHQLHLETC